MMRSVTTAGVLMLALFWSTAHAEAVGGKVLAIKGEVTAASGGDSRSLMKGSEVLVTDSISTGASSYAVVEFIDGGKATIRPESTLIIEKYAYQTGDDGALLNLVKGGLRAITGSIAKDRPESYQVQAGVATLGVRGTEFAIRLCEQDCAREEESYAQGIAGFGYEFVSR